MCYLVAISWNINVYVVMHFKKAIRQEIMELESQAIKDAESIKLQYYTWASQSTL